MTIYHDYLTIHKDGTNYQIPKITKQHIEWCKEGYIIIIDLKNNRDMVEGVWTKPLNF